MIPPSELEGKQFKKAVKGYNTADVDEHIEFIVNKYYELYVAYNELEKKYAQTSAELEVFKNNEDAIRRALVEAQNTKAKIIRDATRRSETILKSSKENCDKIIASFKEQINYERTTLATLKAQVEEFKYRIFSQYQQHIEYLEQISPDKDTGTEWNLPTSEYAGKVVAQIVFDVERSETEAANDELFVTENGIDDETLETLVADNAGFDVDRQKKESEEEDIRLYVPEEETNEDLFSDTAEFKAAKSRSAEDLSGDTKQFDINVNENSPSE